MPEQEESLVTIIIPVFNREKYLLGTLRNIKKVKYRPLELILVDDGSDNKVSDLLKDFKKSESDGVISVQVLRQFNQGAPVARNFGFSKSHGTYIQFLDSDDLIDPEKFGIQIASMKIEEADFGLCDFYMNYVEENRKKYYSNGAKIHKVTNTHGSFGCGSPLLRRDLAKKLSWNSNLKRQQDMDYFLRAALLSKKIAYVPRPLYTYNRHNKDHLRISAIYANTDPVYTERLKSLINTPVSWNRWKHKMVAIFNMYVSILKFQFRKSFLSLR